MIRIGCLAALVCTGFVAGGCGGSSRSAASASGAPSTSVTSTATSSGVAATSISSLTTASLAPSSSSTSTSASVATTSAGSIGHDGGPAQGRGGSGGRGVHYSELPALFTITPGGGLDPTAVSLPTVRAVRLAVVSKDGRGHRIAVRMPLGLRGVTVAAHGRAAAVISGVRPGRYVVDVDGLARGVILVG